MIEKIRSVIPENLKNTALLRTFGFFKVPLIFAVRPRVIETKENELSILIPLTRFTRNHLKSMYFGTLAIGADCAGGLIAIKKVRDRGVKASIVFKDFKASFLKRPEADTVFTCSDGRVIDEMIDEMIETQKRVNRPVRITATTPDKLGSEPVAEFELTLSLKLT